MSITPTSVVGAGHLLRAVEKRPPVQVGPPVTAYREPTTIVELTSPDHDIAANGPQIQPFGKEAVSVIPGLKEEISANGPEFQPFGKEAVSVIPGLKEEISANGPQIQPFGKEAISVIPGLKEEVAANGPEFQPVTDKSVQVKPETDVRLNRLRKAAEDIEAIYLTDLVSKMRSTHKAKSADPMAGFANDHMNQAIATSMAKAGGIGIGKLLYDRMSQAILAQIPQVDVKG